MAVSIDQRDLEALRQLTAMMDLVKDPKRLQQISDNASAKVKEMDAKIGPYTTVEKANALLAQVEAKVAETNKLVKDADATRARFADEIQKAEAAHAEKIAAAEKKLSEREAELEKSVAVFGKRQAVLDAWVKELEAKELTLQSREVELAGQERLIRDKAAAIRKVAVS